MGGWVGGQEKEKKTKNKNYETSVVPAYRVPYTLFSLVTLAHASCSPLPNPNLGNLAAKM